MSTSDAFTVPCSQPSEYFPKPSLAWLLHSASSQVFAIACVRLCAHTQTLTQLLTYTPFPTTVESSHFPSWISPPYLLLHTVPPLAHSSSSSFLQLLISLWFILGFFFQAHSLFHFLRSLSHVLTPLLYDDHPLQHSFPSSPLAYLSLIECQLLHFPPLCLVHPLLIRMVDGEEFY